VLVRLIYIQIKFLDYRKKKETNKKKSILLGYFWYFESYLSIRTNS
jgi:hypothetical protein